jgi:hypothetical protein
MTTNIPPSVAGAALKPKKQSETEKSLERAADHKDIPDAEEAATAEEILKRAAAPAGTTAKQ